MRLSKVERGEIRKRERFWNFKRIFVCALWNQVEETVKKIIDENKTTIEWSKAAACFNWLPFSWMNSRIPSISHSGRRQEWMPVFQENFGRPNIHFHLIHKISKASLLSEIRVKNSRRYFFSHTYWNGNTALLTAPRCCSSSFLCVKLYDYCFLYFSVFNKSQEDLSQHFFHLYFKHRNETKGAQKRKIGWWEI